MYKFSTNTILLVLFFVNNMYFFLVNHQLKMSTAKPSAKSVFIKKAPFLVSDNNFKFNFKLEDEATNEINKLNLENVDSATKDNKTTEIFHFQPSNNSFRFNFSENIE